MMGARQNSRARERAVTVFLQREERNSVKLMVASRLAHPAAVTASCSCPMFMLPRLTEEKISCMEVFNISQP